MPYIINMRGVCQNPQVIPLYYQENDRSKPHYAALRLAEFPTGSWAFGFEIQAKGFCVLHNPSLRYASHTTRQDALTKGLLYLAKLANAYLAYSDDPINASLSTLIIDAIDRYAESLLSNHTP